MTIDLNLIIKSSLEVVKTDWLTDRLLLGLFATLAGTETFVGMALKCGLLRRFLPFVLATSLRS